jgi:hypothetical protein
MFNDHPRHLELTPKAFANFSPELTPKAFANFSPGLERAATTLGSYEEIRFNPERVRQLANPFRVCCLSGARKPRVLATLEPWAEISQRLRR